MTIYNGYEIPNTFEEIVEISKHCVFGMGVRIPSLQYRIDGKVINIPVTLDQVEEASKSGKEEDKNAIVNMTIEVIKKFIDHVIGQVGY